MSLTPAQPPEKFLLWGGTGLNTATGGLNFGVSYPVLQIKGLNLLARGTGELGVVSSSTAGGPRFSLRADALASYPLGVNAVYGGPGMVAGVGVGEQSSLYGLGLTVGYRANFSPKLGGFVEGQLNRYWNSTGAQTAPGLRTGITFRF